MVAPFSIQWRHWRIGLGPGLRWVGVLMAAILKRGHRCHRSLLRWDGLKDYLNVRTLRSCADVGRRDVQRLRAELRLLRGRLFALEGALMSARISRYGDPRRGWETPSALDAQDQGLEQEKAQLLWLADRCAGELHRTEMSLNAVLTAAETGRSQRLIRQKLRL